MAMTSWLDLANSIKQNQPTGVMEIAFVTGANRGIGFELAKQLIKNGYFVHATFRNNKGGLESLDQSMIMLHRMDVRSDSEVERVFSEISVKIDLLVNNAGVYSTSQNSIENLSIADVSDMMQVNGIGPLRVTKAAMPNLKLSKSARIVNISTGFSSISDCSGGYYGYRGSKAALNMFSIATEQELSRYGISTMLICPGWVATDMGGFGAPLSPKKSVNGILERISELNLSNSGRFVSHDGDNMPW